MVELGIKAFSTTTQGIGGKVKEKPEDFIVQEIRPNGEVLSVEEPSNENLDHDSYEREGEDQLAATLVKKNYTTNRAIRRISDKLGISSKRIGYAGNKDKRAITAQRITIWKGKVQDLVDLDLKDIVLKDFECRGKRIHAGDLSGNRFRVRVRRVKMERDELEATLSNFKSQVEGGMLNYFGKQRFGNRLNNHKIGLQLMKGNIEEAVRLFLTGSEVEEDCEECRDFLDNNWGEWKKALEKFPKKFNLERSVLHYLYKYPRDFANSFRNIPKRVRKVFIHSVQSYIFNQTLSRLSEKGKCIDSRIPLPGYDTNLGEYQGDVSEVIDEVMGEMDISLDDFEIGRLPELSSKGTDREGVVEPKSVSYEVLDDSVEISFELPKGSYATIFLRDLMKRGPQTP